MWTVTLDVTDRGMKDFGDQTMLASAEPPELNLSEKKNEPTSMGELKLYLKTEYITRKDSGFIVSRIFSEVKIKFLESVCLQHFAKEDFQWVSRFRNFMKMGPDVATN